MELLETDQLEELVRYKSTGKHNRDIVFMSAKYHFETMNSAPFFGEETLGVYVEVYKLLAESDYTPALYELGLLYYNGEWWLEADFKKSHDYHLRAAELGYADAMFELYVYYFTGIGVAIDNDIAMNWCRRSAKSGNIRAAYNMGCYYATKSEVEVEDEIREAIKWYRKAADGGHKRALETLEIMYRNDLYKQYFF